MLVTMEQPRKMTIDPVEALNPAEASAPVNGTGGIVNATANVSYVNGVIGVSVSDITLGGTGTIANGATWLVVWTLIAGAGVDSVAFNESHGICIQTVDKVIPMSQGLVDPSSPTQWKTLILNNVTETVLVKYSIIGTASVGSDRHDVIFHDPTIVVTQDPII